MPADPLRSSKPSPADLAAAKRLKALWDQRARGLGLTQEKMAGIMGVSQGAVSHYLSGRNALNYRALMHFAKALGTDPILIRDDLPELALSAPVSPDRFSDWVGVLGYPQAAGLGSGAAAQEWAEVHKLAFRADSLARKHLNPDALRVMYGRGDSMEPTIRDGDAILFDTSDIAPRHGRVYVLLVDGVADEEYNVKRCRVSKGIVTFVADNPDGNHEWTPQVYGEAPIKVVGRVRWTGGWL